MPIICSIHRQAKSCFDTLAYCNQLGILFMVVWSCSTFPSNLPLLHICLQETVEFHTANDPTLETLSEAHHCKAFQPDA